MKIMRYLFTLVFSVICGVNSIAQSPEQNSEELYKPLEFKKAYEAGSRDLSGKVPDGYWQNRSKYVIDASLNPETRLLEGEAAITYYNNSPDSLRSITLQAYHDYLKPYAKRKFFFPPEHVPTEDHEGFIIDLLAVEGDTIDLHSRERVEYGGTNYTINLDEPLPSQDSLELQVEWNYVIPRDFVRSGAIDSTSMFVAYWYPEIAVKDDIDGWDQSYYDTATEFYHDFSEYEVSLSLPDNFVVWASVAPENPEDVYTEQTRKRLEQARNSAEAVKIITEEDFKKESSATITWEYKAKDFPDFSFALSDHFLWEASMYKDDKRDVFAQVAYPPDHQNYDLTMSTIHETLDLFHNTMPKYPFPYEYFTIFNGNQGVGEMEFPGMANNAYYDPEVIEEYLGRPATREEVERAYLSLAVHEMGHMYFPFLVGLNEKNYAWMDEGFADFLDSFLKQMWPPYKPNPQTLGSISRTPLMVTSREHEGSWINSYDFGSAMYFSLYNLLGEKAFTEALHAFMDEWKYKHPTPYDMFNTFNRNTEMDLTWFFNNWLFDWGYIDLEIVAVEDQEIILKNNGGKAVSFKISTTTENGRTKTEVISPSVWKNSSTYLHDSSFQNELSEVKLEIPLYGDAVPLNNNWKRIR